MHRPGWLDLIGKVPLTAEQREALRESLVDEFVARVPRTLAEWIILAKYVNPAASVLW